MTEGLRGFYRGVLSPVLGRSPISAILFTGLGTAQRKLESKENLGVNTKNFLAGFFAGL